MSAQNPDLIQSFLKLLDKYKINYNFSDKKKTVKIRGRVNFSSLSSCSLEFRQGNDKTISVNKRDSTLTVWVSDDKKNESEYINLPSDVYMYFQNGYLVIELVPQY